METATNTANTKLILLNHLRAVGRKDLGAVLADYDDSSIIYGPDDSVTGIAEIKVFFTEFFQNLPHDWKQNFRLLRQDVHDDIAYIVWNVISHVSLGTDTFIVHEGKIKVQTYAINYQV
jgi:ketosteroid isomerase-like protein